MVKISLVVHQWIVCRLLLVLLSVPGAPMYPDALGFFVWLDPWCSCWRLLEIGNISDRAHQGAR